MTDYSKEFCIFTDGSSLPRGNKVRYGGWAYYVSDRNLLNSGYIPNATNNVAELIAILKALTWINDNTNECKSSNIYIISDSDYAIKVITGINKCHTNVELVKACMNMKYEIKNKGYNITFVHTYGHMKDDNFLSNCNNIVDKEARSKASEGCKQ